MKRHEQELLKVAELKKIQEQDFRRQIKMQDDVEKLESEQKQFLKTRLHTELLQ